MANKKKSVSSRVRNNIKSEWTIMLYIVADDPNAREAFQRLYESDLDVSSYGKKDEYKDRFHIITQSYYAWSDFNERERRKRKYSAKRSVLAVYTKQTNEKPNFYWREKDLQNISMSETRALTDFIRSCKKNHPARNYLLLLWGHGTGFGMFDPSLNPPAKIPKGRIIKKTGSQIETLTGQEIGESLKKCFEKDIKRKIDLLVMMGCANQMIEFGYELRKYCKYLVASEELIYFDGYNYSQLFSRLFSPKKTSPKTLGQNIIKDTKKDSRYTTYQKKFFAISCVDLGNTEVLAFKIDSISKQIFHILDKEMIKNEYSLFSKIRVARLKCKHFGESAYTQSYIDVAWFFEKLYDSLKGEIKYKAIGQKAKNISKYVKTKYVIEKFIGSAKAINPLSVKSHGANGVSFYFPSSQRDHNNNGDRRLFFERNNKYTSSFTNECTWHSVISTYMKLIKKKLK